MSKQTTEYCNPLSAWEGNARRSHQERSAAEGRRRNRARSAERTAEQRDCGTRRRATALRLANVHPRRVTLRAVRFAQLVCPVLLLLPLLRTRWRSRNCSRQESAETGACSGHRRQRGRPHQRRALRCLSIHHSRTAFLPAALHLRGGAEETGNNQRTAAAAVGCACACCD
jgi:hypothetical protein